MQTSAHTDPSPYPNRAASLRQRALAAAGFAALVGLLGAVAILDPLEAAADPPADEPNVVLLLTDDQTLEEMRALPATQSLIGGRGVTFSRAYVSFPLCCPSRATILSGQYMHNNGVRGNSGVFGGWGRFYNLGTEAKALPTWLNDGGYYNVQIGKYMNGYGGAHVPPGWDEWYGKFSEFNPAVHGAGIYFNYTMREDPPVVGGVPCPSATPPAPGEPFTCSYGQSETDYQTDVLRAKAVDAVHRLGGTTNPQRPFFLSVGFNAPHAPYVPAPRLVGAFATDPALKPPGQNEKNVSDKPGFLRKLPRLSKRRLGAIKVRRRARLEMLLSVDQAVASIVQALEQEGELDNTYIIFTSDNGYFSGEHRIRQGKYLPHEPSSHVPLLIRGPGLATGSTSNELVSNVDIAETIRDIADVPATLRQDGRSLLPFAASPGLSSTRPILLEAESGPSVDDESGEISPAALKAARRRARLQRQLRRCDKVDDKRKRTLCRRRGVADLEQDAGLHYRLRAPAYRAIRTNRYLFTRYANRRTELYDMSLDPAQLRSRHKDRRYRAVRQFLLAELNELSGCSGTSCSLGVGSEPLPLPKKGKGGGGKGGKK